MKKVRRRVDDLEDQFISWPTILHMPNGTRVLISGPKNYLLTLASACTNRENATKEQVTHDLFRCAFAADDFFFKIGEAFHEENRGDDGREEIIEHHGFVEIKAFERGFIEDEVRPAHRRSSMTGVERLALGRGKRRRTATGVDGRRSFG